VQRRVERLAVGGDARHAEPLELHQELAAHHLDPLEHGLGACPFLRRVNRAIEIVDHVEELGQRVAAGTLDVLGHLAAEPEPRVLELARGLAVFHEVLLRQLVLVGDLAFQRKCFDRMEELIKRQGKTVLLVSHNIRQVQRMCSRAILLDRGKVKVDGDPTEVCNLFYKNNNEKVYSYQNASQGKVVNIRTSEELELHSLDILDEQGQPLNEIEPGGRLRVRVRFKVNKHLKRPEFVIGTHTTDFVYLNSSTTAVFKDRPDYPEGMHELEYVIPFFPFVPGAYCIRFVVFDQNRRNVFEGETLKIFMVSADAGQVNEPGLRMLKLPAEWKLGGQKYCDSFSSQAQNF